MSPPIFTPDGSEVSEIVLPDGSTASQVIGPDGNVVFEAGPDIPDNLVDNFETAANEPFGIYESGDTLSTYYTGYGPNGLSSFDRESSDVIEGDFAVAMNSGNTDDDFGVSEPGQGLLNYPDNSDTVRFLTKSNGGSFMGLLWGTGDANGFDGYGFEADPLNGRLLIIKWENSGNRVFLAQESNPISNNFEWYFVEADMPDANGNMAVRVYEVNADLTRGGQIGTEATATDTEYKDNRGTGFYKRGNDNGTAFDFVKIV